MSSIVVRAPREGEADVLATLHTASWHETYAGVLPDTVWGADAHAGRVRLWTALCDDRRPEWHTAVAELDGTPIGIAHATPEPEGDDPSGGLRLCLLYVLASAHGSGAGRALHDAVLGEGAASLWVLDGNARAIAFYRRAGFTPDGTRRGSGFEDAPDEVRFVRGSDVERRAHTERDRTTEGDTHVD